MPGRRIVLAAALASSMLCPPRAGALDAHTLLNCCTVTAVASLQGPDAIRRACPGIDPAVVSLGMGSVLPADWAKKTSTTRCGDLGALAARYAGRPSSTPPAVSDLRTIALRLQQPDAAPYSSLWWDHVKGWLRRRLAPLAGLLKGLHLFPSGSAGPGLQAVLLAGAGVLILLGVATIIFMELRAAGLFGPDRRRQSNVGHHPAQTRVVTAEGKTDDDVDTAHALDRPASALRMLIEALRRSQRIQRDGSLTCREVLARAVFDTPGQREEFANIALLAERELFGLRGLSIRVPDELRPALRALYTQLLAAPPARAAIS